MGTSLAMLLPPIGIFAVLRFWRMGQVDWRAFFDVLRNANFAGPLMIERERGDQRVADIKSAKEFVSRSLMPLSS